MCLFEGPFVRTFVRSYMHIKAHAPVCVRAHIRVYASMNFPDESMSAHMHTNIHTYKYTDSRTCLPHVCTHMRTHACLYTKLEKSGMFQAFRFMVGPGHCPMISKYGPSLSKAMGPVDLSLLVLKISHFNKSIQLKASL